MTSICFHNADKTFRFPQKKLLKQAVIALFSSEGKPLEGLNYIFCSDEYLLKINREYLNHDYYTDIITFPLSDASAPIFAEIYISLDRVKENSIINDASLHNETLRVIFHGALHLCGYNDKSKQESAKMRVKESFYINYYSLMARKG